MAATKISSRIGFRWVSAAAFSALLTIASDASGQSNQKFYYWLTVCLGDPVARVSPPSPWRQGFVVEVDSTIKTQVDALMNRGHEVGIKGHIAAGVADYNRNHYEPNHPNWHSYFTSVDSLRDFTDAPGETTEVNPNRDSLASDIEVDPQHWIATSC